MFSSYLSGSMAAFTLGSKDVVGGEAEFHAGEGSGVGGIAGGNGLELDLAALGGGSAQQHDDAVLSVFFREFLDSTLILKVHGPSGCSHEALGGSVRDLASQSRDGLLDDRSGDAVPFSEDDELLAVECDGFCRHGVLLVVRGQSLYYVASV